MQIDPLSADHTPPMANLDRAHASLNAAYNAIALDRDTDPLQHDVKLAHFYVREAMSELTSGHGGPSDAGAAARFVLPRLEHALQLLDGLGATADPTNIAPLLDELGQAMDHVETALAAVGWD
jgi:hypothetical protein